MTAAQGRGGMLAALRAALPRWRPRSGARHHRQALELELAAMADRVARAELAASRAAAATGQAEARARAAEAAMIRLQDNLDHLRRQAA